MGEQEVDPYRRAPPYTYECTNCGNRVVTDRHPETCPRCGSEMQDLSVPRE